MNQNQAAPENSLITVLSDGFQKLDTTLAALPLTRGDHAKLQQTVKDFAKHLDPVLKEHQGKLDAATQRAEALQAELNKAKQELDVLRFAPPDDEARPVRK